MKTLRIDLEKLAEQYGFAPMVAQDDVSLLAEIIEVDGRLKLVLTGDAKK